MAAMEDMEAPRISDWTWRVEVSSQPLAVDWDDDGFTDLILAPEGRFFRRKPGVEKDLMAKEGWPGVSVSMGVAVRTS